MYAIQNMIACCITFCAMDISPQTLECFTAQSCVFGEYRYQSDSRKKNANSVFYLCPFKSAYSLQAVKKRLIIKINVLLYYSGTSDQHVRLDK